MAGSTTTNERDSENSILEMGLGLWVGIFGVYSRIGLQFNKG